jgi:hypothetical protein
LEEAAFEEGWNSHEGQRDYEQEDSRCEEDEYYFDDGVLAARLFGFMAHVGKDASPEVRTETARLTDLVTARSGTVASSSGPACGAKHRTMDAEVLPTPATPVGCGSAQRSNTKGTPAKTSPATVKSSVDQAKTKSADCLGPRPLAFPFLIAEQRRAARARVRAASRGSAAAAVCRLPSPSPGGAISDEEDDDKTTVAAIGLTGGLPAGVGFPLPGNGTADL